jgi:Raf kinase inhibitor-like YbhB/YbcL family protein
MRPIVFLSLLALSCSGEGAAGAGGSSLASRRPETSATAPLQLSSTAFAAGGRIPLRHSAYGDGLSLPLAWAGVPAEAQSLVVVLEDPDAVSARPFVHWIAWDIDPGTKALPEGLPARPELTSPLHLHQGRNSRGRIGYFGPRPHGAKPHHYHLQLFALDARPQLPAGASRPALLAAMNGHVIAKGEIVGLFAQPSP